MSLYHEAASILELSKTSDSSLKSLVFSGKEWKSHPKTLFALTTEAAKWSEVISEAVEKSGVLQVEKQVCIFSHSSLCDSVLESTNVVREGSRVHDADRQKSSSQL